MKKLINFIIYILTIIIAFPFVLLKELFWPRKGIDFYFNKDKCVKDNTAGYWIKLKDRRGWNTWLHCFDAVRVGSDVRVLFPDKTYRMWIYRLKKQRIGKNRSKFICQDITAEKLETYI